MSSTKGQQDIGAAQDSRQCVLIVEDDPMVSALLRELLGARNLDLIATEDAESALEVLARERVDLVITDKNLPGMSGLDLTGYIKKELPGLDVIIMTAFADMHSALVAFEHGVYDYLVKPFDSVDEVARKIMRALEKRRLALENLRLIVHLTEANEQIATMNRELENQVLIRTEELRAANTRLEELTLTDDVTGLYNQRYLFGRLEEEFERDRRYGDGLALIMMDLDYFKRVNDYYDHLFGSRVLRRIGAIVKQSIRTIDVPIRYGGDEFVIILGHTPLDAAVIVAERVRAKIAKADVSDGSAPDFGEIDIAGTDISETFDEPYHITASLGVAALRESEVDGPKALLQAADRALYAAKRNGRDRIYVARGHELCPAGAGVQ